MTDEVRDFLKKRLQEEGIEKLSEELKILDDIGYYYDENGYKRFGIIPKSNKNQFPINININVERDDGRTIITSNPEFLL